ncbi:MAG: hypothetical protein U9P90_01430 [Patescibacteria group bacterium]|nr:hypothetical protein [Patescibacteria group bacterium]
MLKLRKKKEKLTVVPKKKSAGISSVCRELLKEVIRKSDSKIAEMVRKNEVRWRCLSEFCTVNGFRLHNSATEETAECPFCGSKKIERVPELKVVKGGKTEESTS